MSSLEDMLPRPEETELGWKRRIESLGYKVVRVGKGYGVSLEDDMKMRGIAHDPEKRVTRDVAESRAARVREATSEEEAAFAARMDASQKSDFYDEQMRKVAKELAEALMKNAEHWPEGDECGTSTALDRQKDSKEAPVSFVLDGAKDIVYGARKHLYGHASTNFRRIARGWEIIFGVPVTDMQVGLAMDFLKTSRLLNLVEREKNGGAPATFPEVEDGFKDKAGYAEATMRAMYERPDGSRFK